MKKKTKIENEKKNHIKIDENISYVAQQMLEQMCAQRWVNRAQHNWFFEIEQIIHVPNAVNKEN